MKTRLITLAISLLLNITIIQAQVAKSINVATPGTLSTLVGNDKTTITNLTLTGTINDIDFATIKQMTALKDLNMGGLNITNGTIPNNAFQNMILNKIIFPASLTNIGVNVFMGATITNLDFSTCPNLQSIGHNAFNGIKLQNNVIDLSKQDKIKFIGNDYTGGTFTGCAAEVILSDNLSEIGNYAFSSFNGRIHLPKKLVSIGEGTFFRSSISHDIIIPEEVARIGRNAFREATISRIIFPASLTHIGSLAFMGTTIPNLDFSTCPNLQSIENNAFNGIKLQNNVIDLSKQDKVKFIGNNYTNGAFTGCPAEVILSGNLTEIGGYAFTAFIGKVHLPKKLVSIGEGVFYRSSISHDIVIPEGVTTIGNEAFREAAISRIIFPASLTNMGANVFMGATITNLDFSTCPNLQSIGHNAFNGIKLQSNVIDLSRQDKVKFTGNNYTNGTFTGCPAEVILSDNLAEIGGYAFTGFIGRVHLPKKLVSIGEGVFYRSSISHDIVIPEGVTTIGNEAFLEAIISRIIFPGSLNSIGVNVFMGATITNLDFSTCPNLQSIGHNTFNNIKLQNNVIDLSRQDKVKFVGNDYTGGAFSGCAAEVILSDNKTIIESSAFQYFKGSIVLPSNLQTIEKRAFYGANMTKGIILPASLKVIEDSAFENVTLPSLSFDKIGAGVSCF